MRSGVGFYGSAPVGSVVKSGRRPPILLLLLLSLLGGAVCVKADTPVAVITLSNGDRVSGRVVAVSPPHLKVETSYAGLLSLKISEIKSWETADGALRERLLALEELKAKAAGLKKAPAPTPAAAKAEGDEGWKRTVNFAYGLARGNVNLSDLSVSFGLSRKRANDRLSFSSLGRYAVRNDAQIAHLFNGVLRYERPVGNLPAFGEITFERDRLKRLDYRFSENAGLTYLARKSERFNLSFDLGGGLTREVYSGGERRTLLAGLLRTTAKQRLIGKTDLKEEVSLFTDLTDQTGYRVHAEVSFTAPLTRHIALRLTGLDRFDSRPQLLVRRNDFSLLTGFVFQF